MGDAHGDGRSIENPDESVEEVPAELPVEGEHSGDAGSEGERVSEPGEGLVPEEGVNEPGTRAGDD
jgi:hypothetical protein